MDLAIVVLRAVLSLGVVLALVWFAGKRLSGQRSGGSALLGKGRTRRVRTQPISVVGRQSLGQKVGLALVDVGGERLLLGVSEHGVNVLTRSDVPPAEEFEEVLREEIDVAELVAADADARDEAESMELDPVRAASVASAAATAAAVSATSSKSALTGLTSARTDVGGMLGESILSPATWRRTLDVVRARTVRR